MKKLLKLLFICFVMVSCSTNTKKVEDINVSDLLETIKADEDLGMAFEMPLDYLTEAYDDFNLEELSEYAYLNGPTINSTAIVIFEVADMANVEKYTKIVQEQRQLLINSFKQYLPGPYAVACDSRIEVRGNYIIFISHDKAEDYWAIVDTYISSKADLVIEEYE